MANESNDSASKVDPMPASIGFEPMFSVLRGTLETLRESIEGHAGDVALRTGIEELDQLLGLRRGTLTIIAGRPLAGTTTVLLRAIEHAALSRKFGVAVCSTEATSDEFGIRLLASACGIGHYAIRRAELSEVQWQELNLAFQAFHSAKLFVRCTPTLDVTAACAEISELHCMQPFHLVVIDGLKQAGRSRADTDGWESRRRTVMELKELARRIDTPVLVSCGLQPALDRRGNPIPGLADLGQWQAVEEFADAVILLHRDLANADVQNQVELRVVLNRRGHTGVVAFPLIRKVPVFWHA